MLLPVTQGEKKQGYPSKKLIRVGKRLSKGKKRRRSLFRHEKKRRNSSTPPPFSARASPEKESAIGELRRTQAQKRGALYTHYSEKTSGDSPCVNSSSLRARRKEG